MWVPRCSWCRGSCRVGGGADGLADAVGASQSPDRVCEQLWVLGGRQMTARERLDVDRERPEPLARGRDLSGLEGVLLAARDMKRNGVAKLANDRREVPALGVAAMLVDEPGGAMHECRAAAAADRIAQVGELGGADLVRRGEELRGAECRF